MVDHRTTLWSTGVFCSLYYIFLILGLGIPIWLKTTSPTLYSLPDVKNLMVHSQMIAHQVQVVVVTSNERVMDQDARIALKSQLTSSWSKTRSSDGSFSYILDWKVRPHLEEESLVSKSASLKDFDEQFGSIESHKVNGKLWIYLLHDKSLLQEKTLVTGHHRAAYLLYEDTEDKSLGELIMDTVQYMIEPGQLIANDMDEVEDIPLPNNNFLIDPEIEVYINFIFEKPEDGLGFSASPTFNDISKLIDHFLSKSGVRKLLDINVSTQMVYYAIDSDLLSSISSGTSKRLINIKNIPTLLNGIESRIVEPNNRQSHNVHVIIPSSGSPESLFTDGSSSPLLSSVSRGDFVILNNSSDFNVLFKMLMRKLVGLDANNPKNGIRNDVFFHSWEIDYVMRKVAQKQILKTLSSLESVEKLVSKITNIVIQKDVAEKMHSAVDMSHQALDNLVTGHLSTAYSLSSKSYLVSERAFYDPSLLELLYFPHDQKFAVYLPLFLPVSLPLLSSLYHMVLFILNRK